MFQGYYNRVIRANDGEAVVLPNKYISLQSYVSTPHQRQDLDSFQDDLGFLHRNTLKHYRSKFEFNTPVLLERDLRDLQNLLNSAIIDTTERKGVFEHYCFDTGNYERATCYIPDITYTPLKIEKTKNGQSLVWLDKVRLAFIEY